MKEYKERKEYEDESLTLLILLKILILLILIPPTMAHKKAAGSTQNNRDSQSKRRGVKLFGGEYAIPGNIIVRQKGTNWFPGTGVDMGRDFTIFAIIEGTVTYSQKRQKKFNGQTHYDTMVSVISNA